MHSRLYSRMQGSCPIRVLPEAVSVHLPRDHNITVITKYTEYEGFFVSHHFDLLSFKWRINTAGSNIKNCCILRSSLHHVCRHIQPV